MFNVFAINYFINNVTVNLIFPENDPDIVMRAFI